MSKDPSTEPAERRLSILLTNDDGIRAPGLRALRQALSACHEVFVVAPEAEMSAVGHAISLATPLRVREIRRHGSLFGHAVSGTPADCVKIAVQEILAQPPDVVVSGINPGANVGVNVLYSGTVSAATEAAFLGVPAAALSLDARHAPDYRFAARFSLELVDFLSAGTLPEGTVLNVNIPAAPAEDIRGVRLTRQGTARLGERFERRTDPRGNVYYWLAGETFVENGRAEIDSRALQEKWISITPIHYDLTYEKAWRRLARDGLPSLPPR